MFVKTFVLVLLVCFLQASGRQIVRDDVPACTDPRVSMRAGQCPDGYCCVRDEFLPTYVYCKKIGNLDDSCTTRPSQSSCPCDVDLYCQPNIESALFKSLYGTCKNATEIHQVPYVGR